MKVNIDISGLEETLKALEECASDKELRRVNKKIVERAQPGVQASMKKRTPVSADNSKSGRGLKGGRSSRPTHGHAKDNIPIEKVKFQGTAASGEVGWDLSDISEYFYMKFVEWGTVHMPPRPFIEAAAREAERPLSEIAEQEYEAFLKKKLGKLKEQEKDHDEHDQYIPKYCPSLYAHFIKACSDHGMDDSVTRAFLEYQILTDFILTNTDRHLNNFGVLRDTNTLQFIGMAPIFDSGNSMFWQNPRLPERDDLTRVEVNSFHGKEMQLLDYVRDKNCVDLQLLPSADELREIYERDPLIPCVDSILLGYQKKIELIAT